MRERSTERETGDERSAGRSLFRRAEILSGILLLASSLGAQTVGSQRIAVTAARGESWLTHLHRSFDETSMGKTGRLGPAAEDQDGHITALLAAPQGQASFERTEFSSEVRNADRTNPVTLRGSDLYRLSCRGCHGETGAGAPPEIGSVLNPVRATSPSLVLERMQGLRMQTSAAQAAEMARQSREALLDRIHNGGQEMPALSHLDEPEIESLLVYLKQLAAVPGAGNQEIEVTETRVRVGELIVKSTCHVCHAAEGENPTPAQIAAGAIPPLSALTWRVDESGLIRKVTEGAPVVMGAPAAACRGRMPVFYYLSEEEAADVYLHLAQYPPEHEAGDAVALASATAMGSTGGEIPFEVPADSSKSVTPSKRPARAGSGSMYWVWLLLLSGGALLLIAMGFTITLREFRRLAMENERRKTAAGARFVESLAPAIVHPVVMLAARAAAERAYGQPRESA
jgi:cytochrome c